MKQAEKDRLQVSMEAAIRRWLDLNCDLYPFPYIGEDVSSLMATAALSVLLAVESTEQYLVKEGLVEQ